MPGADKEFILQEIRRCAAANGGVPLGRARFEAETGVRQDEWLGRYWTRWSDAVREAGFPPNQFQGAHSDAYLLGCLAVLARELGSFPTYAEIKMRRQNDPSFPSHGTFARLGDKGTRIARLSEFCASQPDFEDVAGLLRQDFRLERADTELEEGETPDATEGFVYLLKSGKHYKIGRSNSAGRRLYELRLQLPEEATLVHMIETDDPVGIEHYWHRRFADRRGNGEWFKLSSADVKAFKRRRKFM